MGEPWKPPPQVVVTPEDQAEFRQMWNDGARQTELARHFGIATSTVSKVAARLGLPSRCEHWDGSASPGELKLGHWVRIGLVLRWVARDAS